MSQEQGMGIKKVLNVSLQDSFDSLDDNDQMLIHATHGLSLSDDSSREDNLNVTNGDDELPKSIVVTNVNHMVFDNDHIKVYRIVLQ